MNHIRIPLTRLLLERMTRLNQRILDIPLDLHIFSHLLSAPKPPRTLLVHLRTRRHAVDREVEKPPRPHRTKESVNVHTNVVIHLHLRLGLWSLFWVGTGVDDPIHVDVEVVGFEAGGVGSVAVEG